MSSVYWFRNDLRLQDNEALNAAVAAASQSSSNVVYPVYGLNSHSYQLLEGIRQHSLTEGLRALNSTLEDQLSLLIVNTNMDLAEKLVKACSETNSTEVYAMECFDPEQIRTQNVIRDVLIKNGLTLQLVGSAYAVKPGTVRKPDGANYRVYTPFYKSWSQLADVLPKVLPDLGTSFMKLSFGEGILEPSKPSPKKVIAGEAFALRTFERFRKRALSNYDELRNRADLSGTSHLSHALAHGEIHPRTLIAELKDNQAEETFRKEIAWREFYADVLHHYPNTLNDYYEPKFKKLRYDTGKQAQERFEAWCKGETGYPMVDAGMRQLLAEGWMHNRVRMIVASFLVKDLHLEWTWGAAHFEAHLSDFDPASNSHGWQWTAGCGTDASPYYRIFNPILQGIKFDPNGNYVRKYIPELEHIKDGSVHEPWELFDGYLKGYPQKIVDHGEERNESLARLEELKQIN